MTRAYLWKRKPKTAAAARKKIARCLGTTTNGRTAVPSPDGHDRPVNIPVSEVYRKLWKDKKERWDMVPLIVPAIRACTTLNGPAGKGKKVLSATLEVGHRGEELRPIDFLTVIFERQNGWRNWVSMFDVPTRAKLANKQQKAGPVLWSRSNSAARNPTLARTHSDVSRSGRTSEACLHDNPADHRLSSARKLAIVVGGLLALAYLGQQRRIA